MGRKHNLAALEDVETLSHGCDGMEAVIGCRLMFRRFRYRSLSEESIIDRLLDKEPKRHFCARLFFRGIASLNGPLYDLFVQSRRELEIVLGRRCCMRRRSLVLQPLILLDIVRYQAGQLAKPPTVVLSRSSSTHE
jgi:hypothetical protein